MTTVGLPAARLAQIESPMTLADLIAIDLDGVPPEGLELVGQRIEPQNLVHVAEALDLVEVDDQPEIVELVMAREQDRFPVGAFVELAVRD